MIPLTTFILCKCGSVIKTREEKEAHDICLSPVQEEPIDPPIVSSIMASNPGKKRACPTCGQSVNRRKIQVVSDMVVAMRKVYMWCGEHRRHEFKFGEIKHLLAPGAEYSRFGDWVHFGGIFYKHGKGKWGMNMKRAREFFAGQHKINVSFWYDPLTKEKEYTAEATIHEVRKMKPLLNEDFMVVPEYEN